MKKIILIIALALLLSACSTDEDAIKAQKIIKYHKEKYDSLPLSGKLVDGIREIEVKAYQFRWDPDTIVVKKGEKIRFIVESMDLPHGFEIEGISIPGWNQDKSINKGEKAVIELAAAEAGTWDIVCTAYCGPGHGDMKGKYIVRE